MKNIFLVSVFWLCIAQVFGAGPPEKKAPPLPTDEIKALVKQLGDDSYNVREKAHKKLEDLGYAALSAVSDAARNSDDLEIKTRARRIEEKYYSVYFNNEKEKTLPNTPSIWMLDKKHRFPKGVKIELDEDQPMPQNGDMGGGKGWCKELKGYDLAAHYYAKVREKYNDNLKKEELENGWKVDDAGRMNISNKKP